LNVAGTISDLMPELPEVEFAARNLRRWLEGRVLSDAAVPPSRITRARGLKLAGARVESVERRGKWLRLKLSTGTLFSHLGMTGKWVRRDPGAPDDRFQKARMEVEGHSVRYLDPRLFGRLVLVGGDTIPEWEAVGRDPLADGLDAKELQPRLARITRSIKETLLDQRLFAGVGNIQAAEALWRAKLHPARPAKSLKPAELKALVKAIDASIRYTLAAQDAPEIEYVEEGGDNPFKVYAREGEPCPRCKTRIKRIQQGGRSTFFCPKCQARRS
jgi:formamidopyrimidine-DNA glycosylase